MGETASLMRGVRRCSAFTLSLKESLGQCTWPAAKKREQVNGRKRERRRAWTCTCTRWKDREESEGEKREHVDGEAERRSTTSAFVRLVVALSLENWPLIVRVRFVAFRSERRGTRLSWTKER